MKTEVTRTVVTLVEVHTRETGDATVKGVSKVSDDSTLSRKVWINGEERYMLNSTRHVALTNLRNRNSKRL